MAKRLILSIVLGVGLVAALAAAVAVSDSQVAFRSAERDGSRVAEVLMAENVVIVLRTYAGGYSPLERAEIVAERLRAALEGELAAEDVRPQPVTAGYGLYIGDRLIVSVYAGEGSAHEATPEALARLWGDNIVRALNLEPAPPAQEPPPAEEPVPAEEPGPAEEPVPAEEAAAVPSEAEAATAEPPAETALDWTGSAQKWVPIFSLESEGVYLGAAQIAGPKSQVDQVKGVAELRLNFKSVGRIYAYVPVRTISVQKLDRVQGVSVWATGDLKLVDF